MSGIPADLMRDLTCLVKASNLSCSQVIWRRRPITAALCAQIKVWLQAIRKNGCLPSRLSCCVRHVRPLPGCETIARSRMWSRPWGQTDAGRHLTTDHGHFPPTPDSCIVLSRAKDCSDTGSRRGDKVAEPLSAAGSLGGLFSVSSEGCVLGRGTNLAGLDSAQEGQKIQPGAKAQLNLAVFQASKPLC